MHDFLDIWDRSTYLTEEDRKTMRDFANSNTAPVGLKDDTTTPASEAPNSADEISDIATEMDFDRSGRRKELNIPDEETTDGAPTVKPEILLPDSFDDTEWLIPPASDTAWDKARQVYDQWKQDPLSLSTHPFTMPAWASAAVS